MRPAGRTLAIPKGAHRWRHRRTARVPLTWQAAEDDSAGRGCLRLGLLPGLILRGRQAVRRLTGQAKRDGTVRRALRW